MSAGASAEDGGRSPTTRRLFLALWPDETQRAAFAKATQEAIESSGGRPVETRNLHVTLLFLGSVAESRIHDLQLVAGRVAAVSRVAPVSLTFDWLEYWKKPQLLVAVAGMSEEGGNREDRDPGPLKGLAETLRRETVASGFAPDLKPFRPHITLARKVHRQPQLTKLQPVTCSFTGFVLVGSTTLPEGSVYTVLEKFPLRQ